MSDIESVLQEHRVFPPPADFAKQANISGMAAYNALCVEAEKDYEGFWARLARDNILWHKPFSKTLDQSNAPAVGTHFQKFTTGHLLPMSPRSSKETAQMTRNFTADSARTHRSPQTIPAASPI